MITATQGRSPNMLVENRAFRIKQNNEGRSPGIKTCQGSAPRYFVNLKSVVSTNISGLRPLDPVLLR